MNLRASEITLPDGGESEFKFTDDNFQAIARLAHENFGLDMPVSKRALVYSRLSRRLRELSLDDFSKYLDHLNGPARADELTKMLSALTTNVTHFFRESHHFDTLKNEVLPPLVAKAKAGGRLRLWSAGCSAGQEPYCLATTLLSVCPGAHSHDIKILATDIDPEIIGRAKAGHYPIEELSAIPADMRRILVGKKSRADSKKFEVSDAVKSIVRFGQVNLIGNWPMKGKFDVIFCRNVAIYFDKATQMRLWMRFCENLNPGGHLMIGHSERLSGDAVDRFELAGITTFRKKLAETDGA